MTDPTSGAGAPPGMDAAMWAVQRSQPSAESSDIAAMRVNAVANKRRWNERAAEGLEVVDHLYPADDGDRPMRELHLPGAAGAPILHVHGGGWTICDLDTHLAIFAGLARASGRRVLAPHARRAPEAPYPAPLDDVMDAIRDTARACPEGFHLSGDSAGANMALAAMLALRDRGEAAPIRSAVLFYGCYRRLFDTPSHARFGDGRYGLSTARMAEFWDFYVPEGAAAPYADLSDHRMADLPPFQIHAAGTDILLDDSLWLACRVREDGGAAELLTWEGMAHGFLHYPGDLTSVDRALESAADFVARHA